LLKKGALKSNNSLLIFSIGYINGKKFKKEWDTYRVPGSLNPKKAL